MSASNKTAIGELQPSDRGRPVAPVWKFALLLSFSASFDAWGSLSPLRRRKFASFYTKANYQMLTFHAPLQLGSGVSPKPIRGAQHPRPPVAAGGGEASIPGTVVIGPLQFLRPAVLPRASSSPQPPGLSVCCATRRGQGLGGDSGGLRTSSRAEFQMLFLVNCLAESELPGVFLIKVPLLLTSTGIVLCDLQIRSLPDR